jgi:hypothetical protein
VTRESVKEQIFNVSHHASVKLKLQALLTSEMVPISSMSHHAELKETSVEAEGIVNRLLYII